jgi:hypothetical protein
MVGGLEVVVGYLIAWAVAKARRAGAKLDDDVDLVIDTELDRLHELVVAKLGPDPALERLELAAADDEEVTERTRRRVADALADAAEADDEFAASLQATVDRLQCAGATPVMVASGPGAVVVGGNVDVHAESGSAAAVTMGNVNVGGQPPDPPGPDRMGG